MAYDEGLKERVLEVVALLPGVTDRRMFGAWAVFARGNMAGGVTGDQLLVRVGPERYEEALAEPHTSRFSPGGRSMRGLIVVEPSGIEEDAALRVWLDRGLAFASSLPPKGG